MAVTDAEELLKFVRTVKENELFFAMLWVVVIYTSEAVAVQVAKVVGR